MQRSPHACNGQVSPCALRTVGQLIVATLLPVLPLGPTMFSPEELIERLFKIVM
jgi:hypothetical protein